MHKVEWYVNWFDSPYYHLLYNYRNHEEANHFMEQLCEYLALQPHARIWDLACGKGRHAISLNSMGFDVTGTDLSANSIAEATQHANNTLDFEVHDMREPFRENYFDAVFNLFTSIGYFQNQNDNFLVFRNVAASLKPGGVFVIDFFNAAKVKETFQPAYSAQRDQLVFNITKRIENNKIIKHIEFSDQGHDYYFEESVSLLSLEDFEKFAANAGLKLSAIFGNYHLASFDPKHSDRLILIFKK